VVYVSEDDEYYQQAVTALATMILSWWRDQQRAGRGNDQ
jgi:hypothetical protein